MELMSYIRKCFLRKIGSNLKLTAAVDLTDNNITELECNFYCSLSFLEKY